MTPQDLDDRAWHRALVQDPAGKAGTPYRKPDPERNNALRRMVRWFADGTHTAADLGTLRPYSPVTNS